MSLNIYGCHAGLEMAISELKTASLRIHLQYSVHTRDALGKQKLGRTFNFEKQDLLHFTKFSNWTMCRASET